MFSLGRLLPLLQRVSATLSELEERLVFETGFMFFYLFMSAGSLSPLAVVYAL